MIFKKQERYHTLLSRMKTITISFSDYERMFYKNDIRQSQTIFFVKKSFISKTLSLKRAHKLFQKYNI